MCLIMYLPPIMESHLSGKQLDRKDLRRACMQIEQNLTLFLPKVKDKKLLHGIVILKKNKKKTNTLSQSKATFKISPPYKCPKMQTFNSILFISLKHSFFQYVAVRFEHICLLQLWIRPGNLVYFHRHSTFPNVHSCPSLSTPIPVVSQLWYF